MLMDIRDYVDSVLQGSQSQSSASLTPVAQTKAFERQNYINNMIKGVLSKVSYALDAIPPSVDISPGPVDNLAFGGLALANKGFKNLLRSGDDVEKLAGAVIKNRVPLTDDFDTAVDIVKSLGQTGKHPQFEDYMKAMDTIKDESTRQLTPQELAKNPAVDAVIERIQPRLNVEDTAKLPTQTGEITVYRGGRDMGDSRMLTPAKQNSGALFFTESEKYAKQYSRTPDQVSGLYKTNIKTDKIFDITNPSHIKQLEKHIQPEALQSIKDSTSHGAIDWATGSQYVDEIEKAGFKGAKFLERPAENITPQLDGSFKLSGKPVYSYALFDKQVPMTRASLPTQTGELNSLNPTGNVLAKYNAKERASLPLGKNITSLAQTSSKSPDEMITIYRGVKDKYGSINSGDFITTNPQLAKDYSGGGKVLSKKVRLGDILDDVSEPLGEEYIYRPQSSLPTQVEGLAKEASKYKSAEEFVTNQPTYYHQSQNKQITGELLQKGDVGYKANKDFSAAKEGIYFSTDKEGVVSKYGKSGGALVEAKLTPKKPLDLGDYDGMYFDGRKANVADIAIENTGRAFRGEPALPMPDITLHSISAKAKNWLQKNGYDLVNGKISTTGAPETVVLDKSIIKTKSQLTDIFNQSKGVQNKGGAK